MGELPPHVGALPVDTEMRIQAARLVFEEVVAARTGIPRRSSQPYLLIICQQNYFHVYHEDILNFTMLEKARFETYVERNIQRYTLQNAQRTGNMSV